MRRALAGLALAGAGAAVVLLIVARLERPPSGPIEPAWDRETCAYCRMHVGERAFAAQLHDDAGEVLFFDDPGCLFHWRAESPGRTGRAYFHHLTDGRWLREEEAGFVAVEASPMGWGFGARDAGEPGTVPSADAFPIATRPEEPAAPTPVGEAEGDRHAPR